MKSIEKKEILPVSKFENLFPEKFQEKIEIQNQPDYSFQTRN